jgi:hypothetical protein
MGFLGKQQYIETMKNRQTNGAQRFGHKHAEAFMLMKYQAEDGEVEYLWNSRDGITPFCIPSKDGKKEMRHVDWHLDQYIPMYQPKKGSRIFVNLTPEKARQYAKEKVEHWWNHPEFPVSKMYSSKEEAIERCALDMVSEYENGSPDIQVVE